MDIIEFNQRIWDLVRSIASGIESTLRVVVDGFGLTIVQMLVLAELNHCGECTIGELGVAMASAPGNASTMCKTLEKKGLVTRNRNPEDERIVLVALTVEGRNLLQQLEEELRAKCDPLLQEYSETDYHEIIVSVKVTTPTVSSAVMR